MRKTECAVSARELGVGPPYFFMADIIDEDYTEELIRNLTELASKELSVGLLGDMAAGQAHDDDKMTILELGIIHEYGAPEANIHARPVIQIVFLQHEEEFVDLMSKGIDAVMRGEMTTDEMYDRLGTYAAELVRQMYLDPSKPVEPIKTSTAKHKRFSPGSTNPLVDSGILAKTASHETRPVERG